MVKAVVLGASGGIGQPLSLLCKISPLIDELSLFDVVNTPGVAADLSHISSRAKIEGYVAEKGDFKGEQPGTEEAKKKTLTGADVVIIPAGVPRKPGMTRDDLFKINAGIVKDLITACAKYCPNANILVISNPVNSTVPIAAEVLKQHNVFNPKKLFGVTTLDVVRAETFIQDVSGQRNPDKVKVPVIGGHSGKTIIPLFSQAEPAVKVPEDKLDALVNRVQFGGDEVVKAKDGAGSATLSMAYAGYRFAESLIKAVKGEKGIVEPTYVYLPGVPGGAEVAKKLGVEYFSLPAQLGPDGVEKIFDITGQANAYEEKLIQAAIEDLKTNIKTGVDFAQPK